MSEELKHYGVKGMKWGVRREIGKQAKEYARAYYGHKKYKKKSAKLQKRIDELKGVKQYSKIADKLKKDKAQTDRFIKGMENLMKTSAKSLSEKDIAQGKRAVISMRALKISAKTVSIGMALLYGIGNRSITKDAINELNRMDMTYTPGLTNIILRSKGISSREEFVKRGGW